MEEKDKALYDGTFRFIVPNFSQLKEPALSAPTFVKNLPWRVMVMPRTGLDDRKIPFKALGFFLECNSESESKTWSCTAFADLRLISQKDCVVNFIRKMKHTFYHKEPDWGFAAFHRWNEVLDPENGYIKDDTIILEVSIIVDAPDEVGAVSQQIPQISIVVIITSAGDSSEEQTLASTSEAGNLRLTEIELLSKNLKDLLTNKDSCDVVLVVKKKEFRAHKILLIARSSIFAAMFHHDTTEKQTGKVVIPDCDPNSFQEFLEYLYTGTLENISFDSAFNLYYTSDKYNVLELKAFCIKYLMQNLTLQNICDVITLADKYDDVNLLTATQDFFNKNLQEILVTSEWKALMKTNFSLANKLLIEMSKAKK